MRYGLRRKGETICSLCASPLKEDHPLDEVLPRVLRDKTRQRVQRIKFHWQIKVVSFPPDMVEDKIEI